MIATTPSVFKGLGNDMIICRDCCRFLDESGTSIAWPCRALAYNLREGGLAFDWCRPGGNLVHPGAKRLLAPEHALEAVLHDGYLPAEGDVGK
eukprot:1556723-Pyramimonas_sp.AAC.1